MRYRKIKADRLFDGLQFRDDRMLIVSEEGEILDVAPTDQGDGEAEVFEGILAPGLINCHCHLELSHMKGHIPEGTGLVDFVFRVVSGRHFPEPEIQKAIGEAEDEMLSGGIVAVGDICNNTSTIAQKQKGRMRYYNFIEASGWLPSLAEVRFGRAQEIFKEYVSKLHDGKEEADIAIVPHAPYSVSGPLWQQMQPFFRNRTVTIHNQETAFEDEFFLQGTGDFNRMYQLMKMDNSHHRPTEKTSLQSYFHKLSGARNVLLVHNTFTTEKDIRFLKKQAEGNGHPPAVFFCLCVNANRYIEGALPPLELLRQCGCSLVLGTDSLASNRSLSIVDEIRTIRNYFPAIPLEEILGWATLSGARALQMEKELGSFDKGKRPGIVLINEKNWLARRIV